MIKHDKLKAIPWIIHQPNEHLVGIDENHLFECPVDTNPDHSLDDHNEVWDLLSAVKRVNEKEEVKNAQ